MKHLTTIISLTILLLISGCGINNYNIAHKLYKSGNYPAAIEYYDKYIAFNSEEAKSTHAALERSECYYQLGTRAYNKKNWILAERFFYLANSYKADLILDNCYFTFAEEAGVEKDFKRVLELYDHILTHFPASELIPQILHLRTEYYTNQTHEYELAWKDYQELYDRYPDDVFTDKTMLIIDTFLADIINRITSEAEEKGEQTAINELIQYSQYPTGHYSLITESISNLFIKLGNYSIENQNFLEARDYFKSVIDYTPEKQEYVENRLEEISELLIESGDKFLQERDVEKAVHAYSRVFTVIPDYKPAQTAIDKAFELENKINKASDLAKSAQFLEIQKEYERAMKLYRDAFNIDPIPLYSDKIFLMENMIEIEKDPVAFAKSIVINHNKGIISERISNKEEELKELYGRLVKSSDWRVLISIGQYRYEVRYDITTPVENYFYVWQVNLMNRTISGLNELSEQAMK
ncbi:MAG: tetratricopeptide repeat protein [Candidatus Cloacimonetes bacterium]|nr:tetratricopeptide repeat protein [Candidatus Cloacimonadota bacterium]